jgi:HAD superfamily hydrolase (TIGR01509 family)
MTTGLEFDTVLLDVDGTLIDSNAAHAMSWTAALREHGVATNEADVRPLIGMGGDKLLPRIARVSEESEAGRQIARRKKELFAAALHTLRPTRGARPLVEFLRQRGVTVVVATSADDHEMEALLEQAGVADLVTLRTSKDDASNSKPDPDILRAAMARSDADRETTVMIGDTPYDIEAADRAHIPTLALRCGGHWSDSQLDGAQGIFDDPADLLAELQRITGVR